MLMYLVDNSVFMDKNIMLYITLHMSFVLCNMYNNALQMEKIVHKNIQKTVFLEYIPLFRKEVYA